ncbi:MAG: glutamate--tRNA ligase [Candidatus Portnoybacteria bacterium]|nr:glutamate--tRNA ligase [Candidatus Portnoybacteria bacterium]
MAKKSKIRVRIAPSPTGVLHIGTVRTALFNYLFAKKHKGHFILRIEDTDKERSKKEFEEDILENLKWLGIEWDEIYRQSQRRDLYSEYLERLLNDGKAYKDEIIWFKNPNKKVVFNDLIRGEVEFDSSVFGDFSLAKDMKSALYNLAVVVDDYEMGITHVIRGEDHISNTPKQILIYEALGLPVPQFAHLPLILGPDKSKLSKRHGAVSVGEYRSDGYLADALINFVSLLGWSPQGVDSPEKEVFSLKELIDKFSLDKVQKGGAVFNIDKLDWFNSIYIKEKDIGELTDLSIPYLIDSDLIRPEFDMEQDPPAYGGYFLKQEYVVSETGDKIGVDKIKKIVGLEQGRIKKLSEISDAVRFFFVEPEYSWDLLKWKDMDKEEIGRFLDEAEAVLCDVKDSRFDEKNLEKKLLKKANEFKDRGKLLWPLRVALSGRKKSPGPFEIASVLGKKECLKRINKAKSLL